MYLHTSEARHGVKELTWIAHANSRHDTLIMALTALLVDLSFRSTTHLAAVAYPSRLLSNGTQYR